MIRCQKCGYSNQNNAQKCIKCNSALAAVEDAFTQTASSNNHTTKREIPLDREPLDNINKTRDHETKPPMTPPPIIEKPKEDREKTVVRRVQSSGGCALIPLSEEGEEKMPGKPITEQSIVLKRDFLDATNTSISRSGHAKLEFRDGGWYIENLASLKTTFVQVNSPVRLTDGDVILIGDALYRFKQKP